MADEPKKKKRRRKEHFVCELGEFEGEKPLITKEIDGRSVTFLSRSGRCSFWFWFCGFLSFNVGINITQERYMLLTQNVIIWEVLSKMLILKVGHFERHVERGKIYCSVTHCRSLQ